MNKISVKVSVEPTVNDRFALWIRSSERAWWKTYDSTLGAWDVASELGLAYRREFDSEDLTRKNVKYFPKEDATVDPEELARRGFIHPPSNA